MNITVNKKQKLFVIKSEKYISCLGFIACQKRIENLASELNIPIEKYPIHSIKNYNQYKNLTDIAKTKNQTNGWKSNSELIPQLIGLEHKKVKVVTHDNITKTFIVGKSTGFIPCHLEIKRKNSSGGLQVDGAPFKSVLVIQ